MRDYKDVERDLKIAKEEAMPLLWRICYEMYSTMCLCDVNFYRMYLRTET